MRYRQGRGRPFLLLLVFLSLLSADSDAQAQYVIYGTVRLASNDPAARAIVKVASQSGLDRMTFTDDMGRFEIRDLPRGRYFVTAVIPSAPDQVADPVEVETSRSFSARLMVNIFLRNKADQTSSSGANRPSVVSVAEATQHVPKAAQKAFEQGQRYRASQQFEKALQSFSRSIEVYDGYFQALAERGHLRIRLGQTAEAAEDFARALALNDRYEPALRGSGICKFEKGDFVNGISELERAAAIDPSNATTHLFLGIANSSLGRVEPARKELEKALTLDPTGAARAHVHLANIYLKDNRFQEASAELEAYLAAAPNAPDAAKLRLIKTQLDARQKP